jgi:hypothetical protein
LFFEGFPCSAIPSTPRSLVFVAGALSRSSGPAHGDDRKDRYRAADHSDPTPRVLSPVHHSTPRLTNSDTTINTPMDNSTVAANLERIPGLRRERRDHLPQVGGPPVRLRLLRRRPPERRVGPAGVEGRLHRSRAGRQVRRMGRRPLLLPGEGRRLRRGPGVRQPRGIPFGIKPWALWEALAKSEVSIAIEGRIDTVTRVPGKPKRVVQIPRVAIEEPE